MEDRRIRDVVIVGGGTAGWIAAAAMAKLLPDYVRIRLIESDAIGTVGVGEATIPQIRRLNGVLGLDEDEFIRETKGTFKLGIEFSDWGRLGESYIHTFGDIGAPIAALAFHHYWLRAKAEGFAGSLWDYSLHYAATSRNRFGRLDRVGRTSMTGLAYAFHFDAGLYAKYLRAYAEKAGVQRTEGLVESVDLNGETGFIDAVRLKSGERVAGDLFIDCSGFRGLLIAGALGVGYQDWSRWLPCDRAFAAPCERVEPLLPYTKSMAGEAGWRWRIPLQHRTGNGHVFCSEFLSEDEAATELLAGLDAPAMADPMLLRFTTGRREAFWEKNCVAIGLSSGFLEPLESTSIHIIQSNISRLIELFPDRSFPDANRAEYNRQVAKEFELIRDFLILHYHQTERTDSEFWRYCRAMEIPQSLQDKMALFAETGVLYKEPEDLFRDASWIQVMVGQGVHPRRWHAMADRVPVDQLNNLMRDVRTVIEKSIDPLPDHGAFIDQICDARQ